jgi:hypothetical protein
MGKRAVPFLIVVLLTAPCLIAIEPVAAQEGINGSLIVASPDSQTVYNDTMLLDLTVAWSVSYPIPWMHAEISYNMDDGPQIAITNETTIVFERSSSIVFTRATSLLDVSGLAAGKHRINIVATGDYNLDNDFVKPLNYSFAPIIFHVRIMTPPDILILSPQNKTYHEADIPLSFAVDTATSWIGYRLDGQNAETISANSTLTGLPDGSHSLVVYANDTVGNMGSSQKVTFTIATPPKISILSPQNRTYTEPNIPLVFASDKPVDFTCYSLNGQLNETVTGNATITGLSNGTYSVTVYANDTFGSTVASETVYFSVELSVVPEPELKPFPTLQVATVLVAVLGGIAGLLFYFRKRNQARINKHVK